MFTLLVCARAWASSCYFGHIRVLLFERAVSPCCGIIRARSGPGALPLIRICFFLSYAQLSRRASWKVVVCRFSWDTLLGLLPGSLG